MHQIVYMSLASSGFSEAQLRTLCELCRQRNDDCDVTGLLLFDGYRFLQALEGNETDVRQTMARISLDRRHGNLITIADGPIAARQFGTWSMDYKCIGPDCAPQQFVSDVKRDLKGVADPGLRATFIGFAILSSGHEGSTFRREQHVRD